MYPYCWSVEEETNRLKLSHCDWDELGQKFLMMNKMDEENGGGAVNLIMAVGSMGQSDNPLCVGVEYSSDCDSGDGISDYDVSDSGNSCLHATGHLVATTCMLNLFGGKRPQLNFRGQCKSFNKKGVAKCKTCADYRALERRKTKKNTRSFNFPIFTIFHQFHFSNAIFS